MAGPPESETPPARDLNDRAAGRERPSAEDERLQDAAARDAETGRNSDRGAAETRQATD